MSEAKYKRVLLKLSGEALAGDQKVGVNPEVVGKICDKIKEKVINEKINGSNIGFLFLFKTKLYTYMIRKKYNNNLFLERIY